MTAISEIIEPINIRGEIATFTDEKYGPHERNNFDIWLATSNQPTPLVVYIHGGGFVSGDKSKYFVSPDLVRFLDLGISVAVINYRFLNEPPYGILASLNDSKRFIQYIRYNALKYNIDKKRIACTGGSAGAGTSLWLAFSGEMADPENEDPVLRESTLLSCAGAFATQSTYDLFQWEKILGLPGGKTPEELHIIARAFGFKSAEGIDLVNETRIRRELDFISRMNKNGAPFFAFNKQKGGLPTNADELNHHPLHAKTLKDKAEEVGLEAIVYAPEIGISDPSGKDLVNFFSEKLIKPNAGL